MEKIILFSCVIVLVSGFSSHFDVELNQDLVDSNNLDSLINSQTVINKAFCLAICNANEKCLSVLIRTTIVDKKDIFDCFMYIRVFNKDKLRACEQSDLFRKTRAADDRQQAFRLLNVFLRKQSRVLYTAISNTIGYVSLQQNSQVASGSTIDYYFVSSSKIRKYNENWEKVNESTNVKGAIYALVIEREIYVSSNNGLYRLDANLNLLGSYNRSSAYYREMYYNATIDRIYVACDRNDAGIEMFDRNLTFVAKLTKAPKNGCSFVEYDGRILFGTKTSLVLINQDGSTNRNYTNPCNGSFVQSLYIENDYLAILCTGNNQTFLYHANGLDTGLAIETEFKSFKIGFDASNRFMITSTIGLSFYAN